MLPFSECSSTEFYSTLDESSTRTYSNPSLFLRFLLIVSSNQNLSLLSGISPSGVLLHFYQLVFTSSCYTYRQSCIWFWHFKASILIIDVSDIYVRLFLLRFETRTCILHFLKMPWIGWWWWRWGSFDDSFQKGATLLHAHGALITTSQSLSTESLCHKSRSSGHSVIHS